MDMDIFFKYQILNGREYYMDIQCLIHLFDC